MKNLDKLDKFVDWFIDDQIRPGSDEHRRLRMFLISHLLGPFLGHPITAFLYGWDPNPYPHVAILGLSITLFWVFPFLVRLFPKHYNALALLSVQNLIFAILWGSYHYGGASSPFLMWFLVVPLLAFFYLGSNTTTRITVFIQITGGLGFFYIAHLSNPGFSSHIPIQEMVGTGIVSAMSASIYVFVMASYYARIVDSQSELLREIARHETTLKELTDAKDEAERANGAKSEFLAKMSHELRTPLNAVLGYSEILLEDAELEGNGEQIADLEKISAAGKHLLSMVNDILDMSKIEAGKMDLFLAQLDLDKFIDEVESTSRPLAAKNTNAFTVVRSAGPLGTANVDATKLRQAVYNLISNAAKFTHNGAITLHARRHTIADGDWIEIAVADTGMGISEEQQKALFSKFTQANPMIASKYGGTGLGLSLSRNLCRLMGGDIAIESTPGAGSRFTIRLPAAMRLTDDPDASAQPPMATDRSDSLAVIADASAADEAGLASTKATLPAPPRKRILIVDDDRSFLELAERLLQKEGFNAICTDVPASALQLARTMRPDVVLLDILMPDVDGWSVLDALKKDPSTSAIPVVILSVVDDRKRAFDAGAHAVLARPTDRADLIRVVANACEPAARRSANTYVATKKAVGL